MRKVHIKNRDINDIQVMPNFSFVTVPFAKAEKVIARFRQKGRKPLITHANKKKKRLIKSYLQRRCGLWVHQKRISAP